MSLHICPRIFAISVIGRFGNSRTTDFLYLFENVINPFAPRRFLTPLDFFEVFPSLQSLHDRIFSFYEMNNVERSTIHGWGAKAGRNYSDGDIADVIMNEGIVTPHFGMWVNHSDKPNGKMEHYGGSLWIFRVRQPVQEGEELTIDYWDTPHFIMKPDQLGFREPRT